MRARWNPWLSLAGLEARPPTGLLAEGSIRLETNFCWCRVAHLTSALVRDGIAGRSVNIAEGGMGSNTVHGQVGLDFLIMASSWCAIDAEA